MAPSPAGTDRRSGDERAAFFERLRRAALADSLDAGTGSAELALALAPLCRAVVGVDRDARDRRGAPQGHAAKLTNVRFVVGDIGG
jgi:predicted RNA methylase